MGYGIDIEKLTHGHRQEERRKAEANSPEQIQIDKEEMEKRQKELKKALQELPASVSPTHRLQLIRKILHRN